MDKLSSLTLPWPTDWDTLFPPELRGAPLILEIGFGGGAYLLHLARTNPNARVIGLEISNRSLEAAERAIVREGLINVRPLHSFAETALHHLFQPGTLAQVHINFPDPWFKSRHSHRRLMQRDTLDAIVSRLTPNGEFYLATDIREYAEMSAELLAATPGLANQLEAAWVHDLPSRGTATKYEARARHEGRPCHYFAYRRSAHPAPDVPVIEELAMPHIVFTSPLSLDEMLARFEPKQDSSGGIHVHLIDAYRGKGTVLFEAHVSEPTIDQKIALMLLERRTEVGKAPEFTLQLGTIGHPRPTEGVHLAVKLLGDWLLSLHPDARPIKHKLQPVRGH